MFASRSKPEFVPMLTELRIRNFAVLEDLAIPLAPGLNAVTGETGAGKSVIVRGLAALVGGRTSAEAVRSGADRALVEGVADLRGAPAAEARLEELGFEAEDGQVVLRREVRSEGRSRAWINGSPATAGNLRAVGETLLDLHGQHDHQRLLSPTFQREVLDAYGGAAGLARDVAALFRDAEELRAALADKEARARELDARAAVVRLDLDEIRRAELRPGEEADLKAAEARLANAELLAAESEALHELLHGGDGSVTDGLARARKRLDRLAETDPSGFSALAGAVRDAYHGVADVAAELAGHAAVAEQEPARLERIRDRQAALQRLKRKHGGSVEDVIAKGEGLRREMDELDASATDLRDLRGRVGAAEGAWKQAARRLSRRRSEAAKRLSKQTESLFSGLGLEGGRFSVRLEARAAPSARGREHVRFAASMNPGFPLAPLARIASGGELSRVMLALKSALAGADDLPTLVFDEIDAGIGGVVASAVAGQLRAVAAGRQVIVVTHLARIASHASRHLVVDKDASAGVASTTVRQVEGDDRVREIARMLGGDPDSAASTDHARALLDDAAKG